jgi:hypothetical protein
MMLTLLCSLNRVHRIRTAASTGRHDSCRPASGSRAPVFLRLGFWGAGPGSAYRFGLGSRYRRERS